MSWVGRTTALFLGAALADAGSQRIYKIDPNSSELLLDFYVDIYGYIEGTIAVGDGSVWIVTVNDRLLERFDLASGESQASITLPSAGSAVVFDHGERLSESAGLPVDRNRRVKAAGQAG